jgi:hypothetical protein
MVPLSGQSSLSFNELKLIINLPSLPICSRVTSNRSYINPMPRCHKENLGGGGGGGGLCSGENPYLIRCILLTLYPKNVLQMRNKKHLT